MKLVKTEHHDTSCIMHGIGLSKGLGSDICQAAFLNSLSSHADPTAAMLATNKARIPDMSTLVVFQCSTKDALQYISTNFDSLLVLKSTPLNHMFDRGFHAKHSTRDAPLCLSFSLFHLLRSARWQVCGFVL